MAMFSRWLIGLTIVILFATAGHAERPQYALGSGDKLRVNVFGHEDLSGEFSVGSTGNISLPLIGTVKAGGRTIPQLEKAIHDKLYPDYLKNPRVSVEVLNFRPFYIIGEVKKPGSYPFVSGMTVVNAVALAGGFTYRAKENDLLIKRANDPNGGKQKAHQETLVMPGDVIVVPERWF